MSNKKTNVILSEKIDKLISTKITDSTPGCGVFVLHDGKIIYKNEYGLANLTENSHFSSKTSFYVASLAKQFTGFCIALLLERGKLNLEDDVRIYLADFPEFEQPIKIKHLVHHMSGLEEYIHVFFKLGYDVNQELDHYTDEDAWNIIIQQTQLKFEPGSEYSYTNSNYFTLAKIIEVVTKQDFRSFVKEELFEKLKMQNTFFLTSNNQKVPNNAIGYKKSSLNEFEIYTTLQSITAASGLITTLEDFSKWEINFHNNQLGNDKSKINRTILQNGKLNDGNMTNYGFGLMLKKHYNLQHIMHAGQFASLASVTHRFPDQKLSVVLFTNNGDLDYIGLGLEIANLFLSDVLEIKFESEKQKEQVDSTQEKGNDKIILLSKEKVRRFEGLYRSMKSQLIVSFEESNGKLLFFVPTREYEQVVYYPISESEFVLEEKRTLKLSPPPKIEFKINENDESTIDLFFISSEEVKSQYVKQQPESLTEETIEDYTGCYYSKRLNATITILEKNQSLIFKNPLGKELSLYFVALDEFIRSFDKIMFNRNPQGKIVDFFISSLFDIIQPNQNLGIRFEKLTD
ncbi:MAG: serine hydrolase domain-containing protein [Candidatus Heimdallarchaeota archaeon]